MFEVFTGRGSCKFEIVSTKPVGYCISAPETTPITIEHVGSATSIVIGAAQYDGYDWTLPLQLATRQDIIVAMFVVLLVMSLLIGAEFDTRIMYGSVFVFLATTIGLFVYDALSKTDVAS